MDTVDGDLSHLLLNDHDRVDTNVLGTYTVTYWMDGADSQGLTALNVTQEIEVFDGVLPVRVIALTHPLLLIGSVSRCWNY